MKIISGRFKGRNFYTAKGSKARPTSTKIRGAIFNILYGKIAGAVVIDMFAGSGGFGLEALSRGSKKAYFCDYDRKAMRAIEEYLVDYGVEKKEYGLYPMEHNRAVMKMESDGVLADVIYIDPPYKSSIYEDVLQKCVPLIKINGTIIIEHDKRASIKMAEGYVNIQEKEYGNTIISIFEYEGKSESISAD